MEIQEGTRYGFGVAVQGPFDQVVQRVKDAFKVEGFGALSEIDVTKALKEKIGAEIEPYTILGMCNPSLASRAISLEHEIGLLLPCNVLVHACGNGVNVSAQDPELMMQVTGNDAMKPIALEAKQRLQRALAALSG